MYKRQPDSYSLKNYTGCLKYGKIKAKEVNKNLNHIYEVFQKTFKKILSWKIER